jgi:transketolase
MDSISPEKIHRIANRLRILSIRATTKAGSGHPTSCASSADLVAALFFGHMRFDPTRPKNPGNDRFILSKGHAAPLLYAAWAETGHFPEKELETLREIDSPFEGHPTPRLDFVDIASGSLGQGLSAGVGMALNAKQQKLDYRSYVLMGDGELAEGSVWEAASLAGFRRLGNLIAILDINRLGQSQETAFGYRLDVYQRRFDSFGWKTVVIDGHSIPEILKAFDAISPDQPLVIIAKTIKGKGIAIAENKPGWHGKALGEKQAQEAIESLEKNQESALGVQIRRPSQSSRVTEKTTSRTNYPPLNYKIGEKVATRKAFANALARLGGVIPDLVVLDGDVENSTYTEEFGQKYPDRFFECYIAEQNMVGTAVGLGAMGRIPVCATFGAFLSRAMDQARMAGISGSNLKLVGTHSGVSIGEDGPSQMALEDLASMRAIVGSSVLSPSDAVSTERLVEKMLESQNFCYLRAARPETPVLYSSNEKFEIGGAKILRQSQEDQVTVVATGITVFEALKAHDLLVAAGIHITLIDAYSIKPLARDLIAQAARKTNGFVVTVEDHYSEGGLGDAVAGELSIEGIRVRKLAVSGMPHSGKAQELLQKFKIDSRAIVEAVREIAAQIGNTKKDQAA